MGDNLAARTTQIKTPLSSVSSRSILCSEAFLRSVLWQCLGGEMRRTINAEHARGLLQGSWKSRREVASPSHKPGTPRRAPRNLTSGRLYRGINISFAWLPVVSRFWGTHDRGRNLGPCSEALTKAPIVFWRFMEGERTRKARLGPFQSADTLGASTMKTHRGQVHTPRGRS